MSSKCPKDIAGQFDYDGLLVGEIFTPMKIKNGYVSFKMWLEPPSRSVW